MAAKSKSFWEQLDQQALFSGITEVAKFGISQKIDSERRGHQPMQDATVQTQLMPGSQRAVGVGMTHGQSPYDLIPNGGGTAALYIGGGVVALLALATMVKH